MKEKEKTTVNIAPGILYLFMKYLLVMSPTSVGIGILSVMLLRS